MKKPTSQIVWILKKKKERGRTQHERPFTWERAFGSGKLSPSLTPLQYHESLEEYGSKEGLQPQFFSRDIWMQGTSYKSNANKEWRIWDKSFFHEVRYPSETQTPAQHWDLPWTVAWIKISFYFLSLSPSLYASLCFTLSQFLLLLVYLGWSWMKYLSQWIRPSCHTAFNIQLLIPHPKYK